MTNPLIVALDVSSQQRALDLVRLLRANVSFFKVGLQLYMAVGPGILREIRKSGGKVFLDLKFHDIPNTVAHATLEGANLGAEMMTLHGLGGERMMSQAREAIQSRFQVEGKVVPKLLAVTILTSVKQTELAAVGIKQPLEELVVQLAKEARNAGLDGIVSSPLELRMLKGAGLKDLLFVTPGIRPAAPAPEPSYPDDQVRTLSASEALREGADYLVIGRPITRSSDPLKTVRVLLEEIQHARMNRG